MIELSNATENTNLKNILDSSYSVKIDSGCLIEYNMNTLTNLSSSSITGPAYVTINGKEAFKKIFPLDSIIKARRPETAGIKYAVVGDISRAFSAATKRGGDWADPKNTTYPFSYRTYYPGIETSYKYWLSGEGQGATISITYPKSIITNKIVVKFEISHSFPTSWTVSGTPTGGSEITLATGSISDIPIFGSTNPGVLTLYYTGSAWTTNESLHNVSSYVSLTALKLNFPGTTDRYIGVIEFSPRWVIDVSDKVKNMSIEQEASDSANSILPVGYVTANSLNIDFVDYNKTAKQIVGYDKSNSFIIEPTKLYLYKQIEIKPYFKIFHDGGSYGTGLNKYSRIDQGTFYIDSFSIDEFGAAQVFALDGAKILQETLCPNILCENYSSTAIIRRLLDNIGFTNYNFNLTASDQSVIVPNYWWSEKSKSVWEAIQELCRDTQMTAVFDNKNILQFYSRDYMYSTRTSSWTFSGEPISTGKPTSIMSLSKQELPSANQVKIIWSSTTTSNYERNAYVLWRSGNKMLGAAALAVDLPPINVIDGVTQGSPFYQYVTLVNTTEFNAYTTNLVLDDFNTYIAIGDEIIELDAIEYYYVPIEIPSTISFKGEYSGTTAYQANDGVSYEGTSYVAIAATTGNIPTNTTYWNQIRVVVDIASQSDISKYRALSQPGSQNFQTTGRYRIKNRKAFGTQFPKDANGNPTSHPASRTTQLSGWITKDVNYR